MILNSLKNLSLPTSQFQLLAFSVLFSFFGNAQNDTEIYLMDINTALNTFEVSNFRNISNNPGYDSQPSFVGNEKLLYSGTENGQTEIQLYYINTTAKHRLNAPTSGGEYSPQQFPVSNKVAAVRLDTTGLQRLYAYDYKLPAYGESSLLLPQTEVAYFAFHDDKRIIASVLGGNQLNLVIANLETKEVSTYIENSGRSIHNVPNSNSVSYTLVNEDKNHDIYLLNIDEDGESYFVCQLPVGIQDHGWLSDTKLLLGSGSKLYLYDLFGNQEWKEVADLSSFNISEISRLTFSPDGKKLALVAETVKDKNASKPPGDIVQKHIAPFNARNLDGFVNAFDENVEVYKFPKDTMYIGRNKMRENYATFYKRTPDVHVAVVQRITIGNTVIDKEEVNIKGRTQRQATIYTTDDETIKSMTFINNKKVKESPEIIVQKQLDAYNKRDIEGFLATYTNDVALYNFREELRSKGRDEMRKGYASFFENAPDLHCEIKNRIIIGNKVIDEEYITANGKNFSAVAIYEVENGLISKVTFIR